MKQLFHLLCIAGILALVSGCASPLYFLTTDTGSEFRPRADGAAAAEGASATIDGLHLAYAQRAIGGGIYGPGKALFAGPLLKTFTMDGSFSRSNLTPAPGFFDLQTNWQGYAGSAGLDPIISWGNWFSAEAAMGSRDNLVQLGGDRSFSADSVSSGANAASFYYVVGVPTPVLPQQGVAVYQSIGGGQTSIRADALGTSVSARSIFGRVGVTWGTATPKVGLDLATTFTATHVFIRTTGGIENTSSSEVVMRSGTATFSGVGVPVIGDWGAPWGKDQLAPFTVSVDGFFAGPEAERAGLTYWSSDGYHAGNAVFAFQSLTSSGSGGSGGTGGTGGTGGSGGSGSFTAPLDTSSPPLAMVYAGPGGGLVDQSTNVTAITQDGTTGLITSYTKTGIDTYVKNTAQGADVGGDALITWGRWVGGTPQLLGTGGGPSNGATIGAEQGFHYVIGKPSPSLPATGTANFTLLGATKPTFGDGGLPAGTLTSAAMAVEWGGTAATKVGVNMTVTMPGDASYQIVTTGGTSTPGTSEISTGGSAMFSGFSIPVTGGARACNGGTCDATIRGMLTGTDGARAGLIYTVKPAVGPPNSGISIVGAAAFNKQ